MVAQKIVLIFTRLKKKLCEFKNFVIKQLRVTLKLVKM